VGDPAQSSSGRARVGQAGLLRRTSEVRLQGSRTTGNVVDIVVLAVDDPNSFKPGTGHIATGVVKAPVR